jgi:uncharacterized protein
LDNHLIVFIKNPQEGKVKTRIAQTLGHHTALSIYLRLLDIVHEVVLMTEAERHIFYSDFLGEGDQWTNDTFHKHVQTGADLGERMKNAFKMVFDRVSGNESKKLVIIGSDCPYLSSSLIGDAFKSLDDADFVVGPTFDGGYYLLGMNIFTPSIFDDIDWSTEHVCDQTLEKINSRGSTFRLLPTLHDIDTEGDWIRYTENQ